MAFSVWAPRHYSCCGKNEPTLAAWDLDEEDESTNDEEQIDVASVANVENEEEDDTDIQDQENEQVEQVIEEESIIEDPIEKEPEEEVIVNEEIMKIYKSEKEKLQETIEELELELKVCVQN